MEVITLIVTMLVRLYGMPHVILMQPRAVTSIRLVYVLMMKAVLVMLTMTVMWIWYVKMMLTQVQ
jgi:hypothetical protein